MQLLQHDWRWKHLYKIRSEEGVVRIRERSYQRELSQLLYPAYLSRQPLDVVILKNRQNGTSTWCSLFCLDCTMYYPGRVADTLADTQPRASAIFTNVAKLAIDNIPKGLRPKATNDNVSELNFAGISSKYIISATKSEPTDILHTSEAPYFEDESKITEAEQMVRRNGIRIMESTGFGVGNLFNERFMEAWVAKQAGKKHHRIALFFPWYTDPTNTVPVYPGMELQNKAFIEALSARIFALDGTILSEEQKHFYDQKYTDLDEEVFQFYPTEPEEAFLHSGRPVFNLELLKSLKARHQRQPIKTEDDIEFFAEPEEDKSYGIGVDTAEGLAHGDNTSITITCRETGEEVAQCTGKLAPHETAQKIGVLARIFPNHLCMIERNNHGHAVIDRAKDDPRIKLYQRRETDKITEKISTVIGWDTNPRSKAVLIDTLHRDLKDGKCIPHSVETYSELTTYVHGERGIMGAMPGKKDDRVISSALANLACREMFTVGSLDLASYDIY
ncbi:MAG TPA: hypothetical protein VGN57_19070 [Pirellulaceae bacterium]|nr:hypothetical protein [Pirellulaceae bacterium]